MYFLVFSGVHPDGCMVQGRDDLRDYLTGLNYSDRQGMQLIEVDESSIDLVAKVVGPKLVWYIAN